MKRVQKGGEGSLRLSRQACGSREINLLGPGGDYCGEASQRESETLSAENARLAITMTQTSNDLTRVKSEVEEVKAELESLR